MPALDSPTMPRRKPLTRVKSERHAELGRLAASKATRGAGGRFVKLDPEPHTEPPADAGNVLPPDPQVSPARAPDPTPPRRPSSWNPLRG